ncbi:hypothetical protein [Caldimonas tepidiphila]|uniref:hypothetical protein n=1 Tax=Caldimonas tepidiphila TaxID=2315841 RepID=UPI000E5A52B6|nr:hypothetical protein [Caldimonas tepidiphila]
MSHCRIGIDPGASGAIVILDAAGVPLKWAAMPTRKTGSATRVNAAALAALLRPFANGLAFLEQVGAMPGQGVSSMFSFGHSAGVVSGVLGALEIETTMVTPQAWKRRAGLIGTDKDAARSRAIELWPAWRELDAKGRGQALADAALIARFGEAVTARGAQHTGGAA